MERNELLEIFKDMFSDIQIVYCNSFDCCSCSSVMNPERHCLCMIGAGVTFDNQLKYQSGTIMVYGIHPSAFCNNIIVWKSLSTIKIIMKKRQLERHRLDTDVSWSLILPSPSSMALSFSFVNLTSTVCMPCVPVRLLSSIWNKVCHWVTFPAS